MKKRIGQFFSLALVAVLLGFTLFPAFAVENDYTGAVTGWWDSLLYQLTQNHSPYWWGDTVQSISGILCQDVCGSSPDGVHHASSVSGGEMVDDSAGSFTYATCTYCHERFKVYASDLQQSYDAQVAELPVPGYRSDGSFFWQPTIKDIYKIYTDAPANTAYFEFRSVSGSGYSLARTLPYRSNDGSVYYSVAPNDTNTGLLFASVGGLPSFNVRLSNFYFDVPISGLYRYDKVTCSYNILLSSGGRLDETRFFSSGTFDHSTSYGTLSYLPTFGDLASGEKVASGTANVPFPVYEVVPDTPISGDIYNINSRPTSITGDYGIIGDNGQIIKVEGDKIVNETNNTYVNPATGTTDTITDWSYDYSTRTYTLTLGGGTTTTVTYGDENVVIKEGDTTYNVYYLVNGSGSEDPGPDVPGPCNHQWSETSSIPATCTVPGSWTLTCSLCNETKTETIPAPGHKWTIKQEVKTEYDEEGNKTQDGYTIFECSVCGEQYKSTDGGAPPGGGGSGSGSSGGVFSGIFGLLVDFLGFFWNTFRDFVGEGVKGFLTALMDGTSSIFGLLNPFNWGG